jgi:hypothetical protein
MATIQKGLGVVWGISSTPLAIGTGVIVFTSQTVGSESDEVEHRNSLGEVAGITTFNVRETLEATVYPSSTTAPNNTIAAAVSANVLPKAGSNLVIVDSADADVGKTWHVVSATKTKSNEDKVSFNVSLRRYAGITNYTALS